MAIVEPAFSPLKAYVGRRSIFDNRRMESIRLTALAFAVAIWTIRSISSLRVEKNC